MKALKSIRLIDASAEISAIISLFSLLISAIAKLAFHISVVWVVFPIVLAIVSVFFLCLHWKETVQDQFAISTDYAVTLVYTILWIIFNGGAIGLLLI